MIIAVVLPRLREDQPGAILRHQQRGNAVAVVARLVGSAERLLFKDRLLFPFHLFGPVREIVVGQQYQRHREAAHKSP